MQTVSNCSRWTVCHWTAESQRYLYCDTQKLCPRVLALANERYLGIVSAKQIIRTKVWWPGIDKAAECHCRGCQSCHLVARPDPPEPIRSTILYLMVLAGYCIWPDGAITIRTLPFSNNILLQLLYNNSRENNWTTRWNLHKNLRAYRSLPQNSTGRSLAELMFNCKMWG